MVSSVEYAIETFMHHLKVFHTFAGVFIWEYIITLDFEWEVYTGVRPWRWSYIAYITARTLTVTAVIIGLVGFNLTREFSCEAWLRSVLATAWFGGCGASFLLLLRGVAIWNRDYRIMELAGFVWLVDLSAACYAISRGQSRWSPLLRTCVVTNTEEFKWSILMRFIVDCTLLGIMIFGVVQKRNPTELWYLLCFQGLFWITAAIMMEVPGVIMPFRNINDGWNLMFQYPQLVVVVIASSRSYRDLIQNISDDKGSYRERFRGNSERRDSAPENKRTIHVAVKRTVDFNGGLLDLDTTGTVPSQVADEESGLVLNSGFAQCPHHMRVRSTLLQNDTSSRVVRCLIKTHIVSMV
ncbi:hypothetical protein BGW80DRAFT_1228801 [Lactifluus volemus]|nr:hypothetical protein BGW80DRAFT_1228801 [Lactifluus volemus]